MAWHGCGRYGLQPPGERLRLLAGRLASELGAVASDAVRRGRALTEMDPGLVVGLVAGAVLLVAGAEALVRGATGVAVAAGVSPLVVGLTIVAFGTSAPELAVSVDAALAGSGEVALGNAVGSNTFNLLLILGVSALLGGLVVHQRIVRIHVPLLIVVTAGTWALAADGRLGPSEGAVGVLGIVVYTVWSYRASRAEPTQVHDEYAQAVTQADAAGHRWPWAALMIVGGLGGLVVGARLLVGAATTLAVALGVSELVIGLTLVAAGTSLPELATSAIAALRGERDIAVGNVVGSNLFNLLAVLGVSAIVAPAGLEIPVEALRLDLPVVLLVTLVALPALASGLVVQRWEGALLLGCYAGYLTVVVLTGTGSALTDAARWLLFAALAVSAMVLLAAGLVGRARA